MTGGPRVFGLDVLRASAVLVIVYGHGYALLGNDVSHTWYSLPEFDGVSIFFVLSGFLIGRILLRTVAKEAFDGRMLVDFWIRRWFRTLPNYFAVLIFLIVSTAVLGKQLPEKIGSYFFFSQNLFTPHPHFFEEAWSLAVEEWFYLLIPIPLYLVTRFRKADRRLTMLIWISSILVVITAFRIYRTYHADYADLVAWDYGARKQVVTRLDSMMFGVLGAYLSLYKRQVWTRSARVALVLGIVLFAFDKVLVFTSNWFYLKYVNLTLIPVATLLLLPSLSTWQRGSGRVAGIVTVVSTISYSMYLLHMTPVRETILPIAMESITRLCGACSPNRYLEYILYWVMTVTGSFLLYRFFERPMTSLRDRFRPGGESVASAFGGPAAPDLLGRPDTRHPVP